MPKMRGLLHSRPKIDEEEWALAQSRTAVRLADLFGHGAAAPAEAPLARDASPDVVEDDAEAGVMPSSAPAGPGPWPGGPRPPIVVEGAADVVGVETGTGQVELVGVMARSGDHVGDDSWQLPLVVGPIPPPAAPPRRRSAPRTEAPATTGRAAPRPGAPRPRARPGRRPGPRPCPRPSARIAPCSCSPRRRRAGAARAAASGSS